MGIVLSLGHWPCSGKNWCVERCHTSFIARSSCAKTNPRRHSTLMKSFKMSISRAHSSGTAVCSPDAGTTMPCLPHRSSRSSRMRLKKRKDCRFPAPPNTRQMVYESLNSLCSASTASFFIAPFVSTSFRNAARCSEFASPGVENDFARLKPSLPIIAVRTNVNRKHASFVGVGSLARYASGNASLPQASCVSRSRGSGSSQIHGEETFSPSGGKMHRTHCQSLIKCSGGD